MEEDEEHMDLVGAEEERVEGNEQSSWLNRWDLSLKYASSYGFQLGALLCVHQKRRKTDSAVLSLSLSPSVSLSLYCT